MCSPGTSRSKSHCYGGILVQALSRRHGALADLGLQLKVPSAHIVHSKEHSNTQLSSSLVLFIPPVSGVLSVSDLCYTSRSPAQVAPKPRFLNERTEKQMLNTRSTVTQLKAASSGPRQRTKEHISGFIALRQDSWLIDSSG